MFDNFIKTVEQVTDTADKMSYPGVLLGTAITITEITAISLAGLIVTTQRRINKFVDKVLKEDEGD